ncbi:MAG: rRNA maturation RNase YbeY [Bacteroidales bacterium]
MILFHIHNTCYKISNRRAIKSWITTVLNDYGKIPGDINIIFCDHEFLLKINTQFLNHDYYTDVITFPYSDPDEKKIQGDIFVDVETVKQNAIIYKETFHDEIMRVIIHGILHLAGEDDTTKDQRDKMRQAENRALQVFGKSPKE